MLIRYYHDGQNDVLVRGPGAPDAGDFREIDWREAMLLARNRPGWVVVPINEMDRGFLAGDGWSHFVFEPTQPQRMRCFANHGRTLEEIPEGLQWSEIWAVLIDGMWRRIVPMRAFTMCRDWPKSQVL